MSTSLCYNDIFVLQDETQHEFIYQRRYARTSLDLTDHILSFTEGHHNKVIIVWKGPRVQIMNRCTRAQVVDVDPGWTIQVRTRLIPWTTLHLSRRYSTLDWETVRAPLTQNLSSFLELESQRNRPIGAPLVPFTTELEPEYVPSVETTASEEEGSPTAAT